MSLQSEIQTALTGDASITSYCAANIYHMVLPLNQNVNTNNIVHESRTFEAVHALDGPAGLEQYETDIKLVGSNTVNMYSLAKDVKRVMHALDSSILTDVRFMRDDIVYDDDNRLFTLNLSFNLWYCDVF